MDLLPEDIIALRKRSKEEEFTYLFFSRPTPSENGRPGEGALSTRWVAPFQIGDQEYPTVDHFMMYSKAMLFGDEESAEKILATESPDRVQELGRQVKDFDSELWREHRFAIALRGNLAKFSQNEDLKEYIFSTGEAIFIATSASELVWGIGLSEEQARQTSPINWKGLNLLGFALVRTRALLESGLEYVSEFVNLGPQS